MAAAFRLGIPSISAMEIMMFDHLRRIANQIDDSWVGDFLGALCLFGGSFELALILVAVMS